MSPNSALNLTHYIGQWLPSEEARDFFRKSRRRAGIALGDMLGLNEQDRSTKPAIVQARAGITSAAMHHPVSIHLFMIWGLLGIMWTAALEHPKRSEDREKALQRVFNPEEYRSLDQEIADEESGEPQVLKIYNRNIRALKHVKHMPHISHKATTSHWCLQVGEYYYELRDPESLIDKKTQEVRPLRETEELFNASLAGGRSKGIWFLVTKNKTLGKGWEELYDSTTFHSHRRIRARAQHMYEQHFADQDDKSQYNLWVNNCQTFTTFLAIAITEPEEQRTIVNKTLTSKSTFWLSAVGSVFASIYFYWCKKVIQEVKPHMDKRVKNSDSSAFWSYAHFSDKLAYVDKRWDYYYLHPQVMLQRQEFLTQTIGPERADMIKRMTSGGIEKMKDVRKKKHEYRRLAQDKYRRLKSADSAGKLKGREVLQIEDNEPQPDTPIEGDFAEAHTADAPGTQDTPDYLAADLRGLDLENKGGEVDQVAKANAFATDKPKHVGRILAKQQEIQGKKQEMKSRITNKYRRWKSADDAPTTPREDEISHIHQDDRAGSDDSFEKAAEDVDHLKGLTLVDNLSSNAGAKDHIEAKLSNEGQESVQNDAMDMATAEMMAQLVLEDANASSESVLTGASKDIPTPLST